MSTTGVRVAALVMAHKNQEQLARLIDRLSHPDVDVFLHLDAKWSLPRQDIDDLCALNDGRVYVTDRISAELLTMSLLQAELVLLRAALDRGGYGYVMLLSGQDYPLRPITETVAELQAQHPRPFVDVTPWHEGNWVETSFGTTRALKATRARVKRLVNERVRFGPANKILRGLNHVVTQLVSGIKQLIVGTPYTRLSRLSLQVAGGAQWWILPADMAAEVLRFADDRRGMRIFAETGSPDETFMQTALVNSPHADRLTINPWDETRQMTRTFTDFGSGPYTGHPRVLTVEDFDRIATSDAWFARKFDVDRDRSVLDLIDERLLGQN